MLAGRFNRSISGMFTKVNRNFGANELQLKTRMKAVNNIKKITTAMKMVATAKMRQDVIRLNLGKGFGVSVMPTVLANETYQQQKYGDFEPRTTLLVPIGGDK